MPRLSLDRLHKPKQTQIAEQPGIQQHDDLRPARQLPNQSRPQNILEGLRGRHLVKEPSVFEFEHENGAENDRNFKTN